MDTVETNGAAAEPGAGLRPTRPPRPEVAAAYRAAGHWRDRAVGEQFDWCVREHGDRLAVVDGERRLTFAEVGEQVRRFAAFLRGRGVAPGDVVSFQLPNVLEAFVTFHATLRIGAVANPIVPIYRAHELRHILAQSRAGVVVIPERFRGFDYAELYRGLRPELPRLRDVVLVGDDAVAGGAGEWRWEDAVADGADPAAPAPGPAVDPDAVALLLYTSGTTAAPKARCTATTRCSSRRS